MRKFFIILFLLSFKSISNAGVVTISSGGSGSMNITKGGSGSFVSAIGGQSPSNQVAVVQSSCTAISGAVDPLSISFNSAVTVGNSIIVGAVDTGEGFGAGAITDNKGNTYTDYPAGGVGAGNARATVFASLSVATGGTSFTVTSNPVGSGVTQNMCMVEVSGITTADNNSTNTGAGTTATTGNITSTGTTDFCYAIMTHENSGTTLTQAGTLLGEDENNSTDQTYNAQYTLPSSGTQNLSVTTGASVTWYMNGACFK